MHAVGTRGSRSSGAVAGGTAAAAPGGDFEDAEVFAIPGPKSGLYGRQLNRFCKDEDPFSITVPHEWRVPGLPMLYWCKSMNHAVKILAAHYAGDKLAISRLRGGYDPHRMPLDKTVGWIAAKIRAAGPMVAFEVCRQALIA